MGHSSLDILFRLRTFPPDATHQNFPYAVPRKMMVNDAEHLYSAFHCSKPTKAFKRSDYIFLFSAGFLNRRVRYNTPLGQSREAHRSLAMIVALVMLWM